MFSKNALPHPTTEPAANAIAAPTTMAQANAGAYDPAIGGAITRAVGTPEESWGKVIAVDPGTGNIKWEHRVLTPPWGGVMATAGNLVFGGTLEGMIFALNATTGERLWTFSSNGPVFASPISYTANGKQLISIPAGDLIVTFGLD
jgi:outer membrane protein assembly factor BamB